MRNSVSMTSEIFFVYFINVHQAQYKVILSDISAWVYGDNILMCIANMLGGKLISLNSTFRGELQHSEVCFNVDINALLVVSHLD